MKAGNISFCVSTRRIVIMLSLFLLTMLAAPLLLSVYDDDNNSNQIFSLLAKAQVFDGADDDA
jgi:hypothetical protein